ncbi:caspase-8 [Astyanax mexicanus]|uniref:caspase-8 n=1 Tax=Astyanax mexicanus TaxID=7994 RepID=UPI0020CB21A7|nr:caspase-8 [Astyanax mexicanus]
MELNTLHIIDEELTKSEVAALKFLCSDVISRKRLENVKDAKDLFLRLREQALLDDPRFLAELLYTIRRNDLLTFLGTNKREVNRWLAISPYRKMLYKLSEDVTAENLRAIKFLLDGLPKAKLQDATFLDVVTEMEKSHLLTNDGLDELVEVLDKCDKQLANQVREFQREQDYNSVPVYVSQPEEAEPMETISNFSIAETSPGVPDSLAEEAVMTDAQEAPATVETPEEGEEFYSLKRRPRGYCLIFNNYDFGKSRVSSKGLNDRAGTHKDADELGRIFSMLHFLPVEKTDLPASEMLRTMKEFAEKDHSEMDAFVCCILSHGNKGTVMGADGEPVQIRDLTLAFAHCQTLLKKPKVFFIQACQGEQYQKSARVQADGDDEDEESEEELEEDAQSVQLPSIPIEADFLIGMATVESYKSFRHTTAGSIYIQELCRQLENSLHRKEDILSILTKVNRKVSIQVLNGHKQMPEPRYTLTKKLVFSLD